MRMWSVDASTLCTKHLVDEHASLHGLAGIVRKGYSMDGYFREGLVDLECLSTRHSDLADEMDFRGFVHNSPLDPLTSREIQHYMWFGRDQFRRVTWSTLQQEQSREELHKRCPECRSRWVDSRRRELTLRIASANAELAWTERYEHLDLRKPHAEALAVKRARGVLDQLPLLGPELVAMQIFLLLRDLPIVSAHGWTYHVHSQYCFGGSIEEAKYYLERVEEKLAQKGEETK